jgi:hypothetical protein
MAEWKKVLVSGSSIEIRDITGSLGLRPNTAVIVSASAAITVPAAINQIATQSNDRYALLTSQSAYFYNHNAGYPTSNAWGTNLQGSYFNNFDANTDVSEILRFMAGLLSQSAPDASPNTKTFGGLNPRFINTVSLTINGRIPSQSTNSDVLYLQSKGFANSGSASFTGFGTVYNASTFAIDYSSSAAGNGSGVSSSNDLQLFGLGTKTQNVFISASTTFNFYSSSNETVTTNNSSSQTLINLNSENSSFGGAIRRTISTTNPAVIPSGYQDGKFTGSFNSSYNPVTFTATSSGSTGWYHFTQSITIYTGSQTVAQGANFITASRVFRSAYSDTSFPANTITHTQTTASLTAISRSLSGAPYLSQSTYLYVCTSSGVFNPLYSTTDSNIFRVTTGSSFLSRSLGEVILNMNTNGTIATNNLVYSSSASTIAKATSTYPSQNDVIKVSASFALNPPVGATGSAQTGFTVANTGSFISASALSRNGSATYTGSGIFLNYFTPGTFGQTAASGTMAIYNRPQGYDGGALTGTTETFSGETYRIKITDNLLSGSYAKGDKFTTSSFDVTLLAKYDLQVKPGFLVYPGGVYKYWFPNPDATTDYKYYARAFQTDGTTKLQLTVNVGRSLVSWADTTSNTASIAIMFEAAQPGIDTGGSPLTRHTLYSIADLTTAVIATNQTNDNQLNPFTTNIDIKGNNNGGTFSNNTYTMPLADTLNQVLNATYKNYIVLIRYKGDAVPITNITVGY